MRDPEVWRTEVWRRGVWRSAMKRAAAGLTLGLLCLVAAAPIAGTAEAATRPGYAAAQIASAQEPVGSPASSALPPRHAGWTQRAHLAPVLDLTEPGGTDVATPAAFGADASTGAAALDPTDVRIADARAPPAEGSA